jgi:Tic22-like family
MKSFFRRSATLGLIGSAILGSSLIGNLRALALPEQDILERLTPVPVFTIIDDSGYPLVAAPSNQGNDKRAVAGVFISVDNAQAFIEKLQNTNAELARKVKIVPVSLGDVYKLSEENLKKADGLNFAYVGVEAQQNMALELLRQNNIPLPLDEKGQPRFSGVPLFVARGGEKSGYLTVQQGDKQVIPLFFDKQQLQVMINNFKQQQPSLASTVKIEVAELSGIIETLKKQNDKGLNNLVLVPSQESLGFMRFLGERNKANPQENLQQSIKAFLVKWRCKDVEKDQRNQWEEAQRRR